jgi:hypothetical protein
MSAARKTKPAPRLATPWQSAWSIVLEGARGIYANEVERLCTELRPRLLAGEWSGHRGQDVAHCHLEWELETTHPWAAKEGEEGPEARLVLAVSSWPDREARMCAAAKLSGNEYGVTAGECLAHDVLAAAAKRGWVEPLRKIDERAPYRLRVHP